MEQAERAVAAAEKLLQNPVTTVLQDVMARLEEAIASLSALESALRAGRQPADSLSMKSRLLAARGRLKNIRALLENMGHLQFGRLERLQRQAGYTSSGRCAVPISTARLAVEA